MSVGYGESDGEVGLNENTIAIFPECDRDDDDDIINKSTCKDASFITNFSSVMVDGLIESIGNNNKCQNKGISNCNNSTTCAPAPPPFQGLPQSFFQCVNDNSKGEIEHFSDSNATASAHSLSTANGILIDRTCQENSRTTTTTTDFHAIQNCNSSPPKSPLFQSSSPKGSCHSSLEWTSLDSVASTVSFVTQIEIKAAFNENDEQFLELHSEQSSLTMEDSVEDSSEGVKREVSACEEETKEARVDDTENGKHDDGIKGDDDGAATPTMEEEKQSVEEAIAEDSSPTTPVEENRNESLQEEDSEGDDTVSESCESEAIVDDIELILMPEQCGTLPPSNVSPKLVRVTELKINMDDVFEDEDDQSNRHVFHSIVDEYEEDEQGDTENPQEEQGMGRLSVGDDDMSSCSELLEGDPRVKGASFAEGESSKRSSSSSSGRRRRSTSGRISSAVQTEITAVEEPAALSGHHGFRKKTSGKSSSARLGIPGGASGKKLNWKSEINLLPSKMKVKQAGFNSFESNDERDQYSPRVAKFTSQDTLNLSSQFLKPSTLYRTRNLSRNLNQFASSESTFMLPMSSEQQLSAESPRFRVSSSTSGCAANFKGVTPLHSYSASAYQISSILSGSGAPINSRRQPVSHTSGYAGGSMIRHFRSSMPDLNAVNKSYPAGAATMADTHRQRRPPSKSKKYHHSSSSGFRLQKRSSSDEETSSLIDESERCLRSSIDLLLTDELPSPGRDSCLRSGFGSSLAAISTGFYSSRRFCSQPNLNDQAYPPDMKDPAMGSPFLPRRLRDMRCSRWAKVILPNGQVAVVAVKDIDEINETLTVQSTDGVYNLPFRKVVFAWKTKR